MDDDGQDNINQQQQWYQQHCSVATKVVTTTAMSGEH